MACGVSSGSACTPSVVVAGVIARSSTVQGKAEASELYGYVGTLSREPQ